MDAFNALWDNPEQRRRPPDDNFQLFTMEEWFGMSSTHKILTGSLQCPLPHEIEPSAKAMPQKFFNGNVRDLLMQSQKATQGRNSNEEKVYVPGCTKFPQLSQISSLNSQEHADCLNFLLKFEGKTLEELSSMEKTEYQLFQSLYSRVKEEQKKYLECAKESWPDFRDRTKKTRGDAHNYFLQYWMNKVTKALSQYPHKYKRLRRFSLNENAVINQKLYFIKNLLNIGKIPVARLPEFHAPYRVGTSILKLRAWAHLHIPQMYLNGTLHKVPVSRDPNAERLARLHSANVVISTSGMRCLLDNHDEIKYPSSTGIGKSWVLPITVKEHRSFCDGKPVTKTIVFIDKQLPKPKMTGYEKVTWYQKHALFAAVVNPNHPGAIEFEIKGEDISIRRTLDDTGIKSENSSRLNVEESSEKLNSLDEKSSTPNKQSSSNKMSELCGTPPTAVSIKNDTNNPGEEDDDENDDDDDTLTMDLPDNEVLSTKQPSPCRKFIKSNNSDILDCAAKSEKTIVTIDSKMIKAQVVKSEKTSIIESEVIKDQAVKSEEIIGNSSAQSGQAEPDCILNKWEKLSPPEAVKIVDGNALPVSSTNLTYNLWCLKSDFEESDHSNSNCADDINLLIRSQVDCCESLGKGKTQPICLATKPEFQLEYGPGIVPLSDLTRQWAKLLIHPDTALARIRVNVHSSEMLKVEKRSILEVEEEAQALYQTALTHTLQNFRKILTELRQLPTGQYLLSHSPQIGSTAELFKQSDASDTVDWHLPRDYGNHPEIIDCDAPWPPIDTSVILPKHLQKQCMPCTFHCPKNPPFTLQSKPSKQKQEPKKVTAPKKKKKNKKTKAGKQKKEANESGKPEEECPE